MRTAHQRIQEIAKVMKSAVEKAADQSNWAPLVEIWKTRLTPQN